MAVNILLPSMSAGMEDAVIARWLVTVGERVAKGQPLAEVETDKATMELEAEAEGIVGALSVAEGRRADVGQCIAVLLAEGESAPQAGAPVSAPAALAVQDPVVSGASPVAPAAPSDAVGQGRARISPVARRMAAAAGIALDGIAGSGPRGRIVKLDIARRLAGGPARSEPLAAPEPAAPASPASGRSAVPPGIGPYTAQPVTNLRRVIARRLAEAKQSVPHFYLSADCELDALVALRAQVNEGRDKAQRISVNDFIVKACARALRQVPEANVIWHGDEILHLADVDISVAVATGGGLLTPILRGADRMSLGTLSAEMKALAERARAGKLRPDEYQGGGFSVSNLGMYGVKTFSAIINPPQSCILAVGAAERRPVGRGESIVLAEVMSITLSVDHRSVDGALGARLLAAIREGIEAPMSLLL